MTTKTQTFKEPWLTKVKKTVNTAVSITWDTCHKIYICADEDSHDQQVEYGYKMERVDAKGNLPDGTSAVDQLFKWFTNSCGLEFIQLIQDGGGYQDVIGQFDYNEEEDDEKH